MAPSVLPGFPRGSRDEWEITFHAVPDIVVLLDRDCRISRINRAGCAQFGGTVHELVGKPCDELFPCGADACTACRSPGPGEDRAPRTWEMYHQQLDKTLSVTTTPVRGDDGEVHFVILVARDITVRKQLEQQLLLSEKMVTIAGLAAGVAHEINTPLSAILQSIQVVRSLVNPGHPDNRQAARECGIDLLRVNEYFKQVELDFYLDGIRSSALNASRIITSLLDFSRPQKDDLQKIDINQLLDNSLHLARADYTLKKKYDIINVEIQKEYGSNLPPVSCVPMEITQVVVNLVKNAVHALACACSEVKPRIILRTMMAGEDAIRIEVADNGPGIEYSMQKRIFDPFYTTKAMGAGTGLGLWVSSAIVKEKHHGRIWVESGRGQGAEFVVVLPVRQEI